MITAIKTLLQKAGSFVSEKDAEKAYDIWSLTYDTQPGNLMLDLDEAVFGALIKDINLENKMVADIGCGTGRHWQKIYDKKPDIVMGFDISEGMLLQLKRKFPGAVTQRTTDNLLKTVPDSSIDFLFTTLTIAHIKDIEEAIFSWSRILKKEGDLVITDFHPAMLNQGGKRSFRHNGKSLTVVNYVHPLEKVKMLFQQNELTVVQEEERKVNEKVKPYYEAQNALPVYERYKNMPIIYGLHLKKQRAAE
jgi:ubiquinone/menaquinone biosynthesis C-methylase UbiE